MLALAQIYSQGHIHLCYFRLTGWLTILIACIQSLNLCLIPCNCVNRYRCSWHTLCPLWLQCVHTLSMSIHSVSISFYNSFQIFLDWPAPNTNLWQHPPHCHPQSLPSHSLSLHHTNLFNTFHILLDCPGPNTQSLTTSVTTSSSTSYNFFSIIHTLNNSFYYPLGLISSKHQIPCPTLSSSTTKSWSFSTSSLPCIIHSKSFWLASSKHPIPCLTPSFSTTKSQFSLHPTYLIQFIPYPLRLFSSKHQIPDSILHTIIPHNQVMIFLCIIPTLYNSFHILLACPTPNTQSLTASLTPSSSTTKSNLFSTSYLPYTIHSMFSWTVQLQTPNPWQHPSQHHPLLPS